MRTIAFLIFLLLAGVAGCSANLSLQATFEKQMKDDRVDGFNVIHIDEQEHYGLVLYTSWTEQYPENKNKPGISFYEKQDQQWESQPGMACGANGISRLGLSGNGYLLCSILKRNMNFEKIRIDNNEAIIFQANDNVRVWYAVVNDKDSKVVGITSDGREVALN